MSKHHNILQTRNCFFISNAGKIKGSCFIADDSHVNVGYM